MSVYDRRKADCGYGHFTVTGTNCRITTTEEAKVYPGSNHGRGKQCIGRTPRYLLYIPDDRFFTGDGYCNTGAGDYGAHIVCAQMTEEFLAFTKAQGNDLSTPVPAFQFPGLKPGDRWCFVRLSMERSPRCWRGSARSAGVDPRLSPGIYLAEGAEAIRGGN